MVRGFGRDVALLACLGMAGAIATSPASAQLYWHTPDFHGAPVTGDEPRIVIPLPGATDAEKTANVVWTMRAGLNVAALQCEFAPSLMTRMNYNGVLGDHKKELAEVYVTLGKYFKRVATKGTSAAAIAAAFDQYTTRTYNSFSTLNAQISFCQTAASISEQALMTPKGGLAALAKSRLAEFRNSLTPSGDLIYQSAPPVMQPVAVPDLPPKCYDKRGDIKKSCLSGKY